MARITYYSGKHERVAMNGHRAQQGVTCAASPARKFKSKIKIPELDKFVGSDEFEIQDRGRAVTARKASHGKAEVFDIYVSNRETMNRLGKEAPEYMEVIEL